ncbi:MAG: PH domain-containing protein [Cyclonatronaceae bacterium]
MRPEPREHIHPKAITAWRINAVLTVMFYFTMLIVYLVFVFTEDFPMWPAWIGILFVLMTGLFDIAIIPELRWRKWRYTIAESEIDLIRGVFIIKRTLIPVNRIQHVDTRQGPILRYFGLSSVTISTAATMHEIPALDDETADHVRNHISKLARVAREDV